jgi:hypothetical protein
MTGQALLWVRGAGRLEAMCACVDSERVRAETSSGTKSKTWGEGTDSLAAFGGGIMRESDKQLACRLCSAKHEAKCISYCPKVEGACWAGKEGGCVLLCTSRAAAVL